MKRHLPYLVIILLLTACASGGWRVVEGDEFTIEFPGIPVDTVTGSGDLIGVRLYYQPAQGGIDSNIYYALSVYTLSDSAEIIGEQLDDMLLKDAEIYAWSMGAFLADSGKVVKSNNYEGREYKVLLASNAGIVTVRKFAKGKHIYTLLVITGNDALENSMIYKFLDSFKLKQ